MTGDEKAPVYPVGSHQRWRVLRLRCRLLLAQERVPVAHSKKIRSLTANFQNEPFIAWGKGGQGILLTNLPESVKSKVPDLRLERGLRRLP